METCKAHCRDGVKGSKEKKDTPELSPGPLYINLFITVRLQRGDEMLYENGSRMGVKIIRDVDSPQVARTRDVFQDSLVPKEV